MPTFAEMTEIANALGHNEMSVTKTRKGFHGTCSCGFSSRRQSTEAVAAGMLVGHVRNAVLDFIRSGRSLESLKASGVSQTESVGAPQ